MEVKSVQRTYSAQDIAWATGRVCLLVSYHLDAQQQMHHRMVKQYTNNTIYRFGLNFYFGFLTGDMSVIMLTCCDAFGSRLKYLDRVLYTTFNVDLYKTKILLNLVLR